MKRTMNTVQRLRREPEILHKYDAIIKEQEKRGLIEMISADSTSPSTAVHYIPHHLVR
ncbi:hypothetical protein DPMN_194520 [Dreissena polymorpha]|uniref:Uncharacterized protein n=1 Tax=Dreissena polymorpha TaxID=45954 RepID=A0A9D4BF39_DREPO|nr:hypothetical protein DPMN_194520 [Dreissena polymorpha]